MAAENGAEINVGAQSFSAEKNVARTAVASPHQQRSSAAFETPAPSVSGSESKGGEDGGDEESFMQGNEAKQRRTRWARAMDGRLVQQEQ